MPVQKKTGNLIIAPRKCEVSSILYEFIFNESIY